MSAQLRRRLTAAVIVLACGLGGAVAAIATRGGESVPADSASGAGGSVAAARAALASAGGRGPQLISQTQAQLQEEPKNWLAWATLGALYVQQGRLTADSTYYPKAEQALDRSLRLNRRDNYVAMTGQAGLAAARHDFTGALRWARQAAQINAHSSAVYSVMTD